MIAKQRNFTKSAYTGVVAALPIRMIGPNVAHDGAFKLCADDVHEPQ